MINSLMILAYLLGQPQNAHHTPAMVLESPAFEDHHFIPIDYTGYGKKITLPLSWQNVPPDASSLAIIMTDLDVPRTHHAYLWAVFNISPDTTSLSTNNPSQKNNLTAHNSWGIPTYHAPKPSAGIHHYQITLYALNTVLSAQKISNALTLRKAMQGHIISTSTLTGEVKSPLKQVQ